MSDATNHTQQLFTIASDYMKSTRSLKLSTNQQLQLYGLYKQATVGNCTDSKPAIYDLSGRYKYNAWMDRTGLSMNDAMNEYILLCDTIAESWRDQVHNNSIKLQTHLVNKTSTQVSTNNSFNSSLSDPEDFLDNDISVGGGADNLMFISGVGGMTINNDQFDDNNTRTSTVPQQYKISTNDIWYCASNNIIDAFDNCINNGISVNSIDSTGRTPLHYICDRGYTDMLRHVLDKYNDIDLDIIDSDAMTALHYACLCEHKHCIELLVQHKCDITICDDSGNTAIDTIDDATLKQRILHLVDQT